MALTLSKLAANTATVAIQIGGDTLNVTYLPNDLSPNALNQADEGIEGLGKFLAQMIKSWDLYEDDAQTTTYPLEAARLNDLGLPTLKAIFDGIIEDNSPNSSTAKTANS